MRPLELDFARRPRASRLGMTLAVAGALSAAVVLYEHREASQQLAAWQVKAAEMKRMAGRSRGALDEPRASSAEMRQEVRTANAILRQLSVPWDDLFSGLAKSGDKSVALLSVQPDPQSRIVRIGGEAKDLNAVVGYAQRLGATRVLDDVYLDRHETRTADPQRPVAFSLVGTWR